MKKKTLYFMFILFIVVSIVFAPYAKVEYLTYKYGPEFESLYKETHMIDGICVCKVYEYTETKAKIYYVESGRTFGALVKFIKDENDDTWILDGWDAVWSKTGSASEFIWPYY